MTQFLPLLAPAGVPRNFFVSLIFVIGPHDPISALLVYQEICLVRLIFVIGPNDPIPTLVGPCWCTKKFFLLV